MEPISLTELDDELFFAQLELKALRRKRCELNQIRAWSDEICLRAEQLDAEIAKLETYVEELVADLSF